MLTVLFVLLTFLHFFGSPFLLAWVEEHAGFAPAALLFVYLNLVYLVLAWILVG
jgi:hypothetical protein